MGRAVIYAMSLGPENVDVITCATATIFAFNFDYDACVMGHRAVKLTRNQSFGPEAADRLSLGVYTYTYRNHYHQASSSKNVPSRVDPCGDCQCHGAF
jgi:hypothetical protein